MAFLPSSLYAPTGTAALFAAATEQEQRRSPPAFSPSETSFKDRMMATAFAPAEKKIQLFSRVSLLTEGLGRRRARWRLPLAGK
jgi:hypothetical protein